jgi:hypothetical protein
MYTGTLIDDLMATVERAEENIQLRGDSVAESLAGPNPMAAYELRPMEQNLVGVA